MKIPRALQQGMMGASQRSLAPSLTALGPNRYLKEKDFLTMVGVAFVLHLAVVVIISILPDDKVTDIPVRALSFKIGGQDRIAAFGAPTGVGATVSTPKAAAAPASSSTSTWRASPRQQAATPAPLLPPKRTTPKIVPVQPVKPLPFESSPRQMPVENASAAFQPPPPVVTQTQGLPSPDLLNQPAIAATPQRFVREVGNAPIGATANTGLGVASGANGGQGVESTMTPGTAQEVRERYEQQISAWIQQHKIYPTQARGAEGRVVMRMRIDRTGYVRYYAIEQSSGNTVLDAAAIDMVRRANPVPAVPASYPAGNLLEFVFPVTFRAPS